MPKTGINSTAYCIRSGSRLRASQRETFSCLVAPYNDIGSRCLASASVVPAIGSQRTIACLIVLRRTLTASADHFSHCLRSVTENISASISPSAMLRRFLVVMSQKIYNPLSEPLLRSYAIYLCSWSLSSIRNCNILLSFLWRKAKTHE